MSEIKKEIRIIFDLMEQGNHAQAFEMAQRRFQSCDVVKEQGPYLAAAEMAVVHLSMVEVRQALEMWKEHEKAENSEKPENALSSQDFVGLIVVKLVSYADWAARHKKYEMVKLLWQEAATQDEPNDRYWQPRYRLLKVVNAHLQGSHVSQEEFGDLQLSVLGESSLLDVLRELRQEH